MTCWWLVALNQIFFGASQVLHKQTQTERNLAHIRTESIGLPVLN